MIFTFFILLISLSLSISLETHHNSEQHIRILKRKVTSKFKNIVLIIADDLGWSDIGYAQTENDDLRPLTPNIDSLASEGILLNNFYSYALCTPSRSSVMSGLFVERIGLQHSVIEMPVPVGLPHELLLMPQHFKNFGYKTHLVGKWHLGSCNIKYTPVNRGFDTFYGFFGALNDYVTHRMSYSINGSLFSGLDFWNQTSDYLEPVLNKNNTHSQISFTERAQQILETHNKSEPFFLYYSAQTPHTDPNFYVPKKYLDMYSHVKNLKRKKIFGMITLLDEMLGKLIDTLEETGLMQDTLIFFMSDNGAEVFENGRNYPLRGAKRTVFEGGHKVRSFIYDGGNNLKPSFYDGMFHSVDWLPTILSAAINRPIELEGIDGINMWNEITKNLTSKRDSFIYSIDPFGNLGCVNSTTEAIREGDWKIIKGCPGIYSDWYNLTEFNMSAYTRHNGQLLSLSDDLDYDSKCLSQNNSNEAHYFLFNIKDDPFEKNNLASVYPCKLKELEIKIEEYKKEMVPSLILEPPNFSSNSNPEFFGDKWLPGWCS